MSFAALFAESADARLEALARVPRTDDAAWAVRDLLAFDEHADVRAAAAEWLGRGKPCVPARALVDALYDTHASVRGASCRGLGRVKDARAVAVLRRLAIEEPVWWVRRAAVIAVARIERGQAIALLVAALDDPFWRVRHAAARALIALGAQAREELPTTGRSERATSALYYVAGKLGLPRESLTGPDARPAPEGKLADADPAVITARLEQGRAASHAELVEYLGDPHEPLRRAASRRLANAKDVRALFAAALWLCEPRIPHAAETVVRLLDALPVDTVGALLDLILAQPAARPGAAVWAISWLEMGIRRGSAERLDAIFDAARSSVPSVRRAAIAAIGARLATQPDDLRALDCLASALKDQDEDVRALGAHGLACSESEAAWRVLLDARSALAASPLLRREIANVAARAGDVGALREACAYEDPASQATALAALVARGLLDPETLRRARESDDPWTRGAVLDGETALDVLRHDPHPPLRREAFSCAARSSRALDAARIACDADDPWLRVRAAERLARSGEPQDAERVYRLLFDPDPAVRASAADAPRYSAAVRERLSTRAAELMAQASRSVAAAPSPRLPPAPNAPRVASPRALGRSGLIVSPLAISGANEPSIASLFGAAKAGCNIFFWEPRYRNMTTFLRAAAERGTPPLVIAGSYHASERSILDDIQRARKTLGRERIDLFLIFWTRSAARLEGEVLRVLARAKDRGLIAAAGFSTHDRALAESVLTRAASVWDVIMVRHSAAHPGAEERLFSVAATSDVGVVAFSATSYGRLLRGTPAPPTAAECYRYSLSQAGVTACVSAPRGGVELVENLAVLEEPTLSPARIDELRAHGRAVREESLEFARHIRRFPASPDDALAAIDEDDVAREAAFS